MTAKRDATKAAIRFHHRWLKFLLQSSQQTMRRVAHEIAALEAENAGYRDGRLFGLLRRQLEFVIRDVGGPRCKWSVVRSRKDRRGRPKRRPRISRRVQAALTKRITPQIGEE